MERIVTPEWQKKTLVKIKPAIEVWKETPNDDIIDVEFIVIEEE